MSNVRDIWLKHKPATKLELINQKLVIPAFSISCGAPKICLQFAFGGPAVLHVDSTIVDSLASLTVEAWIKLFSYTTVNRPIFYRERIIGTLQYSFVIYDGFPRFICNIGGTTYTYTATNRVDTNIWNHVAVTFDNANQLINFYINGELITSLAHTAGALTARVSGTDLVGYDINLDIAFSGYLDDIRVWNSVRTLDQISYSRFSQRKPSIDTNLIAYLKLNEGIGLVTKEEIRGLDWTLNSAFSSGDSKWITNEGFPQKYGASFIVLRYSVSLGKFISFKFPINILNPDHSLVIQWTDVGVIKRKYLYKPPGVDYDASITKYLGEKVSSPFNLEIWNIDGNSTVNLTQNLTLKISPTTQPVLVSDQTSIEAASLVADSTLAENFPWNFPLLFNTQQIYT